MPNPIWNLDDLIRFAESEDPEVRFWAIDRMVRHFPAECCDAIADSLLDDHEATPATVARHLGEHGDTRHHAILAKGFGVLRGVTPGFCLQALIRLGYPGVVELASAALNRGDLNEPALAIMLEALAELDSVEARELVLEFVDRRGELLVEPAALRAVLKNASTDEIAPQLRRFVQELHRRGTHRAGESFRILMDSLQIDDAAWCFRTGPSGHIELRKTIKAVESGYDCDIISAMGESTIKQISQKFRAGNLADVVRALAEWTCQATLKLDGQDSDLPQRLSAAVGAFADPSVLAEVGRLDQQFQHGLLGFQLSAAIAVARGHDPDRDLRRARGNLELLLRLAEMETAHLLGELPVAIALVCRDDENHSRVAQEWCLRMLEAQGPFFPKVVALDVLGRLRAIHFVPEVIDYLTDENSYVYGAAERALARMGEAILGPAVERIESETLDPEAAHSLLVLFCDLGTQGAYEVVSRRLDWFMESVGPGATAEWVSLFGMEELIDPLRDWLDEDPPMVGQALLLLGSIHNVTIPEEDEILQAIEDERARQAADDEDEDELSGGSTPNGGNYVM